MSEEGQMASVENIAQDDKLLEETASELVRDGDNWSESLPILGKAVESLKIDPVEVVGSDFQTMDSRPR